MAQSRDGSTTTLSGRSRGSGFESYTNYSYSFNNSFSQDSINHPDWRTRSGKDIGGPWFMTKVFYDLRPIVLNNNLIQGPIHCPTVTGWSATSALTNTEAEVKASGTTAIARSLPSNPTVDLATAIGELRAEGLPSIVGTGLLRDKSRFLKGSGSEYLNVEFGWKPLVSDLKKFAHAVRDHHEIIAGYRAGSNSKIRRRYQYPPSYTQAVLSGGAPMRPAKPSMVGTGTTYETKETRSWFSGAFRYYVPIHDDLFSRLERYNAYAGKLLGLKLSPEVVWNLSPWSWAVDWFSDTGDIITNISNLGLDGMAMEYGYSMRSTKKETTTSYTYSGRSGLHRVTTVTKRRVPASPYGFNTTFDGLSNRQKAIVAALGLTRVR